MLRSPRTPLLGALACFGGLVLTGVVALLLPVAHARDSATLDGFRALNQPRLTPLLDHVAHLADPRSYALIGLGLAGVALLRGRWRVAVAIVVLLVLTGWTSETLKALLASPRAGSAPDFGIAEASWPSGHATASLTLALSAVLAVPARLRPTAAAVGAVFATSVSYAILALGWHFPSDVLGGFLVALTWTLLALAALAALERRWPSRARREGRPRTADALAPLGLGLGLAAGLAALALRRPDAVARFAADHASFLAGAVAIGALAAAGALGLARGVRSAS